MVSNLKIEKLQSLVADLSPEEIIWLNGYTAALAILTGEKPSVTNEAAATSIKKLTISYGTETGNAKKMATALAAKAKQNGLPAKLISLDQYRLADLEQEEYLVVVISTQGEGEPPAAAKKFYDHLYQTKASLPNLKYAVLALGDAAYPLFCKAGEDVDVQLQKLGAQPVVALQKLDAGFEDEADSWFESLLQSLNTTPAPTAKPAAPAKARGGRQWYKGRVLTNINLNGRGSAKATHHIEIAADDVAFEPGDAIGVVPPNGEHLILKILSVAGVSGSEPIQYKEAEDTVAQLLQTKLCVHHLSERVLQKYAALIGQDIPGTRMDLLDLLRIYPVANSDQFLSMVPLLEPITPRLYSIASSPAAHRGEVHLTVGKHYFEVAEVQKTGLCSAHLSALREGDPLNFYIQKNHSFGLAPADKDIIMIGPGTGVAPFRSFIAERDATGATGRSWLFFGDQHFTTDFLYQTEWQAWLSTGVLTKMNVAFSRDGKEKQYVQHKMLQHAAEIFEWLENGASVYICGAKEPMSVDVENTLLAIIASQKACTPDAAAAYLQALKESDRYLKDVY